jgi:mRNA export factor
VSGDERRHSSWDGKVRIYQTGPAQTPSPPLAANKVAEYAHAPQPGTLGALLDIAWSRDGTKIYSVGTDKRGFIWDSASQQQVQFAQHAEPIKCVRVVSLPTDPNSEFVCTASWDKTLKARPRRPRSSA